MNTVIDESVKQDIRTWSHDLLVTSRCLDMFPTPADKLAAFIDLEISPKDLSKIKPVYLDKDDSVIKKLFSQIRGLLVREAKVIFLDRSCIVERQRFTLLHEVGHNLPWQVAAATMRADDDFTLSPETKEQFEAEASYFASETLFQGDKFISMAQTRPLTIETPIQIAPYFGASIHATLRRYVEFSPAKCALLVMKAPLATHATLRNLFYSQSFLSDIGCIHFEETLEDMRYPFVESYIHRVKSGHGQFYATVNDNVIQLRYEFFYNGYNGFVLIYP